VTEASAPPSAGDVAAWLGSEVDAVGGARVGRADGAFVDLESGEPAWLIVELDRRGPFGRRRPGPAVAVPVRECAGAAGRVWTALGEAALRSAPHVDPIRPLLREHEATICGHYGIGEGEGRHAEVAGRPAGAVTARPAGS
jgi:hypothetical protein